MNTNKDVIKNQIKDNWYLFPVRQSIQDGIKGVELNEFSAFLWDHLEECDTVDQLLEVCQKEYELDPEDLSDLREDIVSFINQLMKLGLIQNGTLYFSVNPVKLMMKIGGINIELTGDSSVFDESLYSFENKDSIQPDLRIQLIKSRPKVTVNGKVVIRSEEVIIMDCGDQYILLNPKSDTIYEIQIDKNGKSGLIFYQKNNNCKEDIFHCIRMIYLYTAMRHGLYAVHSVSVLNDDGKAVLFSASSGTGKSTHAGIWEKVYGTPTINGDLNLVGIENEKPVVYGMPWCGTSGIYSEKTYPLKCIVLLKRGTEDKIEELSEEEKAILVQQRMISPFWSDEEFIRSLEFTQKLISKIKVCRAYVTMNDSAAVAVKEYIDHE